MSKGLKIVGGIIVAILVVVVLAVWYVAANLDGIVKGIIEDVGSDTLGTPVALSSVAISLGDASAKFHGLTIRNPQNFDEKNALTLGGAEAAIDIQSIGTPEIVLPRVVVNDASVVFEQKGGTSNLQTLMNNLSKGSGGKSESPQTESGEEIKLVIQEFRLSGTQVKLIDQRLGKPLDLKLGDIVLRDIGRKGSGATTAEATQQIMKPILDEASRAAPKRLQQEREGRVRDEVDKQAGKALESLTEKLRGK